MSRTSPLSALLPLALLMISPMLIGSSGLRTNLDERLLSSHNRARSQVGVGALSWDPGLAADARLWADELARSGRFEHSRDEAGVEPQGENLWAGSPGAFGPEAMVGLWVAEKRDYKPGVFPNNSRSGDLKNVSHYTQLIWVKTAHVGCALSRGRREEVLVCRYSAPGNVLGERPL